MSEFDIEQFDAAIFDHDMTLGDTHQFHNPARLRAFETMHAATGDRRFINISAEIHDEAHHHGSSPYTIIGWALQQAGIVEPDADLFTHDVVAMTVAHKDAAYCELVHGGADAIPGALEFVEAVHGRLPRRLAIGTNARRVEEWNPFMLRHDLGRFFPDELIVCREDITYPKPHPEVYDIVLHRLGMSDHPRRAAVFEDHPHGIEAAKAAGTTVVALATTLTVVQLEALPDHQSPDIIAPDYAWLNDRLKAA